MSKTSVPSRINNAIKQLELAREKTDDELLASRIDAEIYSLKIVKENHD